MPPRLFIATPTADGVMAAGHLAALAGLLRRLGSAGIGTEYHTLDGRDVVVQRDELANRFLSSPCTHLLFIDSDMAFPPTLAERLAAFDKPLVGAVCTRRELDFGRLSRGLAERPFDDAVALAYGWNIRIPADGLRVERGLARVHAVGAGFVLIRRDCLTTMAARLGLPRYGTGESARLSFFQEMREGEELLSQDYAFCRRWAACGGEVWADTGADIRHLGDDRHAPPFIDYLKALRDAPPAGAAQAAR